MLTWSGESLAELRQLSKAAYAEYRRWVDGDSFAAQAGVHDYDDNLDRFQG